MFSLTIFPVVIYSTMIEAPSLLLSPLLAAFLAHGMVWDWVS
jgi:hypothetical protein